MNDSRFGGSFNTGEINHPAYVPKFKDDVSGAIITPDPNFNPGGSGYNSQGFVFQYMGDKVRARLNVLESKNKITTLSTPMILTANGEVSRVFVGEERPLNRSFRGGQTVTGNGGNVTTGGEAEI